MPLHCPGARRTSTTADHSRTPSQGFPQYQASAVQSCYIGYLVILLHFSPRQDNLSIDCPSPPSRFGLYAASRPPLSLYLSPLFPRLIYFFIMIPFGLRPCLFLSPMLHISAISSPKFRLSSGLSSTPPQRKRERKKSGLKRAVH